MTYIALDKNECCSLAIAAGLQEDPNYDLHGPAEPQVVKALVSFDIQKMVQGKTETHLGVLFPGAGATTRCLPRLPLTVAFNGGA